MFFPGSRYANAGTYQAVTPDGGTVTATRLPLPVPGTVRGWYRRSAGERLDVLAAGFLGDPTQAWALGWTDGSVSLDALAAREYLAVPVAAPTAAASSTSTTAGS